MPTNRLTLGAVIRNIRKKNDWTLKQMSLEVDIPISTLSKIEHEQLTLTYDKILQLSENLNISISELFSLNSNSISENRSIGTLDSALRVETPNYEYFFLCPELRHKRMTPSFGYVRCHSLEEFGDLVSHPGEEFVFVVSGSIVVHTQLYDPATLNEGESIYIDANMGHAYLAAPGCREATIVGVMVDADQHVIDALLHVEADTD